MKGLQIDIRGKIMNCVTPKGQVCVFVEADNMVVLGEDKENSVKLDWGKIELAVGQKYKDIDVLDRNGKTVKLSSMIPENEYVMLEFLALYAMYRFLLGFLPRHSLTSLPPDGERSLTKRIKYISLNPR